MYLLTQSAGWGIVPDYAAVFRPSSYRWLIPALDNPTEASQLAMPLGGLLFVVIGLAEVLTAIRGRTRWLERAGIYFCAAVVYYILGQRGGLCCDGEHVALSILRPCPDRPGVTSLSESIFV